MCWPDVYDCIHCQYVHSRRQILEILDPAFSIILRFIDYLSFSGKALSMDTTNSGSFLFLDTHFDQRMLLTFFIYRWSEIVWLYQNQDWLRVIHHICPFTRDGWIVGDIYPVKSNSNGDHPSCSDIILGLKSLLLVKLYQSTKACSGEFKSKNS